jgi:hypothetical protein
MRVCLRRHERFPRASAELLLRAARAVPLRGARQESRDLANPRCEDATAAERLLEADTHRVAMTRLGVRREPATGFRRAVQPMLTVRLITIVATEALEILTVRR